MKRLALCYKYFDNPKMLAYQYERWAGYRRDLKDRIQVVVVDDASRQVAAIDVPRPDDLPELRMYRITTDRDWGQNGATNLSAFVASAEWLLITDMDHVVNETLLDYLLNRHFSNRVYMLDRVDAPMMTPTLDRYGRPKPHPNTYMITKQFYWEVGGHDEHYCGLYGTDRLLRNRIRQKTKIGQIEVPIVKYDRTLIDDASTTTLNRKEGREKNFLEKAAARKKQSDHADRILTLQFEWDRLL